MIVGFVTTTYTVAKLLLLLQLTDDKEGVVRRQRHDFDSRRHVVVNDAHRTDV